MRIQHNHGVPYVPSDASQDVMRKSAVCVSLVISLLCATRLTKCQGMELKVNDLPNLVQQTAASRAETAVIRKFQELHPDIQLVSTAGLNLQGSSNWSDMAPLMSIAGDVSPDVLYVNFRLSDVYIQKGFLKPLDEYVRGFSKEELRRRVPPSILDVCYRLGPDGKKHWYTLPTQKLVRVLKYRRDLFARAGLDPERPPKTWSELEAYCKKLSDPAKGVYGIGFVKGNVSAWDFANLVWSRGGDIIARNKNGDWEARFNTPEVVEALYLYVRLNNMRWKGPDGKYHRGVAYRDVGTDLNVPGVNYAMAFDYLNDRMNVFQPELIGYAPVPHPDICAKSASEINANMLGVFAGIKDPARAKAAFDYIAFLDSDEANRIRVKVYIQRGYGRFVSPELLKRFGYVDYLNQVDTEWQKAYNDVLTNGKPEPYGKNCAVYVSEISRPVEQAINDRAVLNALDRGDDRATKRRLKEILDRAEAETSERMFGTLPPSVQKLRYLLTCGFLAVALIGFLGVVIYLVKTFRREAPSSTPGQKKVLFAYVLLAPAAITILVWQYLPYVRGAIMALQDYNVMGKSPFVGLGNFSAILFDPNFWHAVYATILYSSLYMFFGFVSPIVLALLLTEVPKGKVLFRTLFYLPAVLSGLVVAFLWKSFYRPSGVINTILSHVGIHVDVSWLDSPGLAMIAVLLPTIWAGLGPGCLIYLAALKTIPEEFYEAADIDGAGIIKKVTSITIPGLRMLIQINALGAFIGAFLTSEMVFAMTGGGPYTPYGATELVGLQLYYTAFFYLKFGLASAMSWVLGFMLIGFTMIQLRNLSRVEFKGGR